MATTLRDGLSDLGAIGQPRRLSTPNLADRKEIRGARTMRARFPAYRDVRSENLRSPLANPGGRMPEGRGSGVRFFRLPFFSGGFNRSMQHLKVLIDWEKQCQSKGVSG